MLTFELRPQYYVWNVCKWVAAFKQCVFKDSVIACLVIPFVFKLSSPFLTFLLKGSPHQLSLHPGGRVSGLSTQKAWVARCAQLCGGGYCASRGCFSSDLARIDLCLSSWHSSLLHSWQCGSLQGEVTTPFSALWLELTVFLLPIGSGKEGGAAQKLAESLL